jgi:LEA14-like dessication related protein
MVLFRLHNRENFTPFLFTAFPKLADWYHGHVGQYLLFSFVPENSRGRIQSTSMKKGTRRVVLMIFIMAAIAAFVWWKNGGKQSTGDAAEVLAPKIHLNTMNITDIDNNSISLVSETLIENRMPLDLAIDSFYYELWIDSTRLVESTYPRNILIPGSDSALVRLPARLKIKELSSVAARFTKEDRDSADYTLKADFRMNVPIAGKRDFDVEVTRRLPALREIKVAPAKIRLEKFSFKQSKLDMNIIISNDNVFDIKVKDARYTFNIEDDLELEGTMEKFITVPAKSTDTITMQMLVKTAKVPKLGWKMLFRDKQTKFKMSYSAKLMSDMEMMKDAKLQTKAEGTLQELKEFVKSR